MTTATSRPVPFVAIPDSLELLRDGVGRFVRQEIAPVEAEVAKDARAIPGAQLKPLIEKARQAGYWMFTAPEEYGGCGLSYFEMVVVMEEAAKHKFSLPVPGGGVFGHEPPLVLYDGTPEQIEKYVVPAIEHGWHTFTAVSEPSGGSDPARAIKTTARRNGDHYVINGRKLWTTYIDEATYGVVYCRTGGPTSGRSGISAIIVDADTPGIEHTPVPVLRDHWTNEVAFNDVVVPAANLIGEEGGGFRLAQRWFGLNRLKIAATSIGVASEAVRLAIEWAQQRSTFGQLLASRQAAQFTIADALVEIEAARLLTWKAAWDLDQGARSREQVSAAKVYASEMAFRVLDHVMQLFGGMGMTLDLPLSHWWAALRVARIVEGPSEVHRYVIAREALGEAAR